MADGKLETRLPRFSLSRRITVLVMLVTIIVLGTVATIGQRDCAEDAEFNRVPGT
jgi:hypothetical protein